MSILKKTAEKKHLTNQYKKHLPGVNTCLPARVKGIFNNFLAEKRRLTHCRIQRSSFHPLKQLSFFACIPQLRSLFGSKLISVAEDNDVRTFQREPGEALRRRKSILLVSL